MYENIIQVAPYQPQEAFSIIPFINKAIQLSNHIVITETIDYLETHHPQLSIDRQILNTIWQDIETPVYTKILITFWWGGLSHQNQAPLFYTNINLDHLYNFSDELNAELYEINNNGNEFRDNLKTFYNKFKCTNYKLGGVNTAFFTKIIQFGITNQLQPIIADKWSMRAVLADMISNNYDYHQIFRISGNNFQKLTVSFRGSHLNEFEKYFSMIEYFNNRCNNLTIHPLALEEIMFGRGRDMQNVNNPRFIASNIILNRQY
jgi:hypothetical protein